MLLNARATTYQYNKQRPGSYVEGWKSYASLEETGYFYKESNKEIFFSVMIMMLLRC